MSKRTFAITFITLLVVFWLAAAILLLQDDHSLGGQHYFLKYIINPTVQGGFVLWFWWHMKIEKSGIALLGFAFLVLIMPAIMLVFNPPVPDKPPTVICDKHNPKNCREFKLP